jgi:hypothetical protein
MKSIKRTLFLALLVLPGVLAGNTAPTVIIQSAEMRTGTTLMDIRFRIEDPDDATVKVRALAFIDGVRSFANVIRPVTFAEGTGSVLGDATATGADHTLTWDVAADWEVQLGQVKFEILAMDGRGLLPFDWITIPATENTEALTISLNSPTDVEVLDALFWLYADGDETLALEAAVLGGSVASGGFSGLGLVDGANVSSYATPFLLKRMNLAVSNSSDIGFARSASAAVFAPNAWYALNRPYNGVRLVVGWGENSDGQVTPPAGLFKVTAIAGQGQFYSLALTSDGRVTCWGGGPATGPATPTGFIGVVAIAAGFSHSLAIKSDGTVVGWGTTPPTGLTGVVAIAAGFSHSLAIKSDGTVVGWGANYYGEATPPTGLNGVAAIAAGHSHSLAFKSDGTVVGWGVNSYGQATPPTGLTGVVAIAAGVSYSLALKSDGTVVGWGLNSYGQATPPTGLTGVVAFAAGWSHSLALKSDGTVMAWGDNNSGQATPPAGLSGVVAIAAGANHSLAIVEDKVD